MAFLVFFLSISKRRAGETPETPASPGERPPATGVRHATGAWPRGSEFVRFKTVMRYPSTPPPTELASVECCCFTDERKWGKPIRGVRATGTGASEKDWPLTRGSAPAPRARCACQGAPARFQRGKVRGDSWPCGYPRGCDGALPELPRMKNSAPPRRARWGRSFQE